MALAPVAQAQPAQPAQPAQAALRAAREALAEAGRRGGEGALVALAQALVAVRDLRMKSEQKEWTEVNDNEGIMSRKENRASDKHAEFTGKATIDGVDYYLDAWVRERNDKSGRFFSIKFKPIEARAGAPAGRSADPRQQDFPDDDIPF